MPCKITNYKVHMETKLRFSNTNLKENKDITRVSHSFPFIAKQKTIKEEELLKIQVKT